MIDGQSGSDEATAPERRGFFWDAVDGKAPPPPCAGRLIAEGRVVHKGRSVAFLEGSLRDNNGSLIATSTATARIVPFEEPAPAG